MINEDLKCDLYDSCRMFFYIKKKGNQPYLDFLKLKLLLMEYSLSNASSFLGKYW